MGSLGTFSLPACMVMAEGISNLQVAKGQRAKVGMGGLVAAGGRIGRGAEPGEGGLASFERGSGRGGNDAGARVGRAAPREARPGAVIGRDGTKRPGSDRSGSALGQSKTRW